MQCTSFDSKERPDTADTSHYSDSAFGHSKLKTEEKHFDQDKDDALAELDSVLNSYHTGSTSKSKKKRKDRESFKNGGTWPRARGGPVIEQGTGTILHPHKYKERLPLSELITNVPKANKNKLEERAKNLKVVTVQLFNCNPHCNVKSKQR